MRVLLVDSIDPSGVALLRERAEVVVCKEASFDGIRHDAREADAVITRSRLPDDLFVFAGKVRAVTIHGTGLDLVPLTAATESGVAKSRGWTLATDDRKGRREAATLGVPVVTTPELVKTWAEATSASDGEIARVLKNIQTFARFAPHKTMPLHQWWSNAIKAGTS